VHQKAAEDDSLDSVLTKDEVKVGARESAQPSLAEYNEIAFGWRKCGDDLPS
jgi:hypothetical protein